MTDEKAYWRDKAPILRRIASTVGTPCYVYDRKRICENYQSFTRTSIRRKDIQIHYAVKANASIAILSELASLGCGFDIVSGGELERVIKANGQPKDVIFSGVGKKPKEIEMSARLGIGSINIESEAEFECVKSIAHRYRLTIPLGVRVNPNINAQTHPYIATGLNEHKFGVTTKIALKLCARIAADPWLRLKLIGCHIGSQIFDFSAYEKMVEAQIQMARTLEKEGVNVSKLSFGGGLGVDYDNGTSPNIEQWVDLLSKSARSLNWQGELAIEPGRSLVANCGVLLTEVLYLKQQGEKGFAIIDAAMNDLHRPALYQSHHPIMELKETKKETSRWSVVGPVCESADNFGSDYELDIEQQDHLAILYTGAYASCMASRYNARPLIPEVMFSGDDYRVIRAPESISQVIASEKKWDDAPFFFKPLVKG